MVVPAKAQTRRAQWGACLFQPCAKGAPASGVFGTIFGHQVRHKDALDPQGLGHFQRPSRGVFDLGQAEMSRLHRQSCSLEGRCGRGQRCRRVIKPAETFGARQANGCQHLGGGVQRREIARRIELIGDHVLSLSDGGGVQVAQGELRGGAGRFRGKGRSGRMARKKRKAIGREAAMLVGFKCHKQG